MILPQNLIRWLAVQPDDVLDVQELHQDILETDYVFQYRHAVSSPIHEDVIRRDLNRQLGSLTTGIMNELGNSFEEYWGVDVRNWKSIAAFDNMMRTITRTTNRMLVGLPLCECHPAWAGKSLKAEQDVSRLQAETKTTLAMLRNMFKLSP